MQKTKPKPKKVKQSPFTRLKQAIKKLSTAERVFVLACIVVGGLFLRHQLQVYVEHNTYKQAEKQIDSFVNEAAKLAPSKTETRRYCDYSSAKFSKGYLSCTVWGKVTYSTRADEQRTIIKSIEQNKQALPWKFMYDNTKKLLNTDRQLGVFVYSYRSLTCGVSYGYESIDGTSSNYDKNIFVVEYDCSGPALKEYY